MTSETERQLLEVLSRPVETGDTWSKRLGVIESLIAELFGGEPQRHLLAGASRADVLVRHDDRPSIGIELKATRRPDHVASIRSWTSNLLGASVSARRLLRSDARLAAVLLFTEPETSVQHPSNDASSGSWDSRSLTAPVGRLLRDETGAGYDDVLLGFAGNDLQWVHVSASEGQAHLESQLARPFETDQVVSALLDQPAPKLEGAAPDTPTTVRPRRFLLVADEWRSGQGGISTVNRELAIALAANGADVAVAVPIAAQEDVDAATDSGVSLVAPVMVPGLSERELMLLRPVFTEPDWEPDVIVGHGRVLGPYAAALQQESFPAARRVHIVHTDAEELESVKIADNTPAMLRTEERRLLERDLAQSADLVVGIGPTLAESITDDLRGGTRQPPVICLIPGLREGVVFAPSPAPTRNQILFVGRADDFHSKGLDLVANALVEVVDGWPKDSPHPPTLIIRGVPPAMEQEVRDRLTEIMGSQDRFRLRTYVADDDEIARDLANAKVLVMPSLYEGFGLSAYEAIAAGVPVLISAQSGLARWLRDIAADTNPTSILTTKVESGNLPEASWTAALQEVLTRNLDARNRAAQLRDAIATHVSWPASAEALNEALDAL